jgi:hypothetical protein
MYEKSVVAFVQKVGLHTALLATSEYSTDH